MGDPQPQYPEHHQAAERVGRPARYPHEDKEQRQEEQQCQQHADEAEFLSHDREDEVGVLFRQECEPLLGAIGVAGPEPPSRADGGLGLDEVISCAAGIRLRVEERDQPVLLVRRQPVPKHQRSDTSGEVEPHHRDRFPDVRPPHQHQHHHEDDPYKPRPRGGRGYQANRRRHNHEQQPGPDPRPVQHREEDADEHEGAAEVGLCHYQQEGDADDHP